MDKKKFDEVFELAKKTRDNAYAPYSQFKVGAVLKAMGHPELFVGNNVENAVNGASVCAERSAISNMISQLGYQHLEFVFVISDNPDPATPCGVCLQVLNEFIKDDTEVYVYNIQGKGKSFNFSQLMPYAFKGKDFLKK